MNLVNEEKRVGHAPADPMSLADWRRRVAEMYGEIRRLGPAGAPNAWSLFRSTRDDLFTNHPQTALTQKQLTQFNGIPYFDYDPAFRVTGRLNFDVERDSVAVPIGNDGALRRSRIAEVHFELQHTPLRLNLYWIEGYGGGLFLPFNDLTNGQESFGGGRYLYDAIKGADLGAGTETIPLDFNFSYNPSCSYNNAYVCPLSPLENRLPIRIEAGERMIAWEK